LDAALFCLLLGLFQPGPPILRKLFERGLYRRINGLRCPFLSVVGQPSIVISP
jgi:hypothetical protein